MKKLFLIILVIPIILLTGCSSNTLKKISFDSLKEKIANKETFVIYFTGDGMCLNGTNILIENVKVEKCRRLGIGLCVAKDVVV